MTVTTLTKAGAKATTAAKLDKDVFALEVANHELVKQAYLAYEANGRQVSATTLKRGEVRGGGKKPWKQKGTGRARAGSTRSPIWRGGGITFGPSGDENFSKSLPKKAKITALKQALSMAVKSDQLTVIDSIDTKGKTKPLADMLNKAELTRSVVIVDAEPSVDLRRAVSNIPFAEVVSADYLNVYKVMNAHTVLVTKTGLSKLTERLGAKPEKKA